MKINCNTIRMYTLCVVDQVKQPFTLPFCAPYSYNMLKKGIFMNVWLCINLNLSD